MNDFVLKVNTEVMKAKADILSNKIKEIENEFTQITERVTRTKTFWEGEANQRYQQYYNSYKEDIEQILLRLKEHPRELCSMAGIFEAAESEVEGISMALPNDVIQ